MDNKFKIVKKAMDQIGFGQLSLYDEKDKVAQIDFGGDYIMNKTGGIKNV